MSLSVSIHAQVPKSGLLFFQLEKSIFKVSVITGYQQQQKKMVSIVIFLSAKWYTNKQIRDSKILQFNSKFAPLFRVCT